MSVEIPLEDFKDDFDPFTALLEIAGEAEIVDPFPKLVELVEKGGPVQEVDLHEYVGLPAMGVWKPGPHFAVLGYQEASEVMLNPEVFSNKVHEAGLGITFGESITTMDAPQHQRYRRLFQQAFTPRMIESLQPRFKAVLDRLMARIIKKGEAELVHDLALHFPFQFIMDLMNMPEEQRALFHKLAVAQVCVTFDKAHGTEASRILGNYLSPLIDERRENGDDEDFIAVMARAEIDGDRLPQNILVSFFRQLMNAGGETSFHGFSNILAALFTHPEQLDAIRQDRGLIKQAIEEGLRWNGPIAFTGIMRETTRDYELGGVHIPKGAQIQVSTGMANRDESLWENPHEFNIHRPPQRHFAFGFGPHICIGQHVARMELTMTLNDLLDRLPNVRLDPAKPPPVIRGFTARSADAVHVRFDA